VVQWRSTASRTEGGEPNIQVTNVLGLRNAEDLSVDVAAAIAEVSQTSNGGLRVKLHDKRAALVDLGRHLGMFAEPSEQTNAITVEIVRFGQNEGSARASGGAQPEARSAL
jgi:hypothetical protein